MNPWYPVLTSAAIFVSLLSIYLAHFRVKGPVLRIMDSGTVEEGAQISILLPYECLPADTRNQYPDYREHGYCALLAIPVVNDGDRSGYLKLLKANATGGAFNHVERESIRCSFYSYLPVPAHSGAILTVLIRNIPRVPVRHGPIVIALECELTYLAKRWFWTKGCYPMTVSSNRSPSWCSPRVQS